MRIENIQPSVDGNVRFRFTAILEKEDLTEIFELPINFCAIVEKGDRRWVNLPAQKDRDKGVFKAVLGLNEEIMAQIRAKALEAVKSASEREIEPSLKSEELPLHVGIDW